MKTYTGIVLRTSCLVLSLVFLNLTLTQAQHIRTHNPASPAADLSPEPAKPDIPPSEALWDLVWNVHTHGYPTAYNEAGIETDGAYIYTTRWNANGAFFRYSMAGAFVDAIIIAGAGGIRDLAYDAATEYMYGGSGATTVYEMNFTNFTLVSSFTAPTAVRAIAWDSDLNIFYANNWSTPITKFTKAGVLVGSFPVGPAGSSYYGFAYCPVGTCTGPKLYGYAQAGTTLNLLVEIDLLTGLETGTYDIGAALGATGSAGGLAFYEDMTSAKWVLLGLCQNEWIWTAEVCQVGTMNNYDVGVTGIVEPFSGWNLSNVEQVIITVKNFGIVSLSNIPVYFTLDGGAQQTGLVAGPLAPGETVNYLFVQTVNLANPGQTYTLTACTQLSFDEYPPNDCMTASIQNLTGTYCAAGATTCDEYIDNVQLNTLNNSSGCGLVGGYSDYTSLTPTNLQFGIPYTITVHNPLAYSGDVVDCWIDWAHDGWDAGDLITTTTSDYMTFTGTFTLPLNAVYGNTRLRTRIYYYPSSADPCGVSQYGEVEDYTVKLDILTPYDPDVGVQSIDAPVGLGNLALVTPLATVRNYGTNTISFPVNMTIGSYSSTKTVFNLAPGAYQQVTFDTWSPTTGGTYTVTACTQLTGDKMPINDCKTKSVTIIEDKTVYGYCLYDPSATIPEGPVTFNLVSPGSVASLAGTTSPSFITCGTWMEGNRWIGCTFQGGYYEINGVTGAMTLLAPSAAGGMSGLTYCWDDGYLFGVHNTANSTDWYMIDPTTFAETFIATLSGNHLFDNLAYNDLTNTIYAVDINDDKLYSISASGGFTQVGSTNLSLAGPADMEVDNNSGLMYLTTDKLCVINQTTGEATVVGDFQNNLQVSGFAIPYVPLSNIMVDLDLWLEGPYDPALEGGMSTWLNPAHVPLTQPFGSNLYNPNPCWLYNGSESVAAMPANVVDWVLVELRDGGTTGTYTVAKQAFFIRNDGKIVALDGAGIPFFPVAVTGPLYAVVYHRNHLAVMSSAGLPLVGTNYTWDFRTGAGQFYGGINGARELEPGVWGARAGDGNADKQVNNTDKLAVWKPEGGLSGYRAGDYNLDAQVNNADKIEKWKPNSGSSSQVPD